jgi:2-oxoisovalerate dehydrogenase E2 component (dihydrolipoyl transacylase)
MSVHNIKMPDIGEGIAEVELVAWRVAVGDEVAEDQILADVMTDKATVEIPSHVAGRVVSLDAQVGEVVAVGSPIIQIEAAVAPVETAQDAIHSKAMAVANTPLATASPPAAMPLPQAAATEPRAPSGTQRALAAPAVRQRARDLGIDLARIQGSGPDGRITHADLDQATNSSNKESYSRKQDEGYRPISSQTKGPEAKLDVDATQAIPVIGLRRKIAQKMQEAKRRIPHFTYVEEVDVTELEALRAQLNAQFAASRGRLTLLPLLIRALVLAVREHPQVNARYDDDAAVLTRYNAVHLGMATQTDGGLMVPVIRNAQVLDLWACAAEITRLAEAARSGKIGRDELTGSTLTVTSLGPLAGIAHTPVINHPEVAIVGPNRIQERLVMQAGCVVVRKVMNVSSSFDHRVVDGMDAARFIQRVRAYLECPATLFVA